MATTWQGFYSSQYGSAPPPCGEYSSFGRVQTVFSDAAPAGAAFTPKRASSRFYLPDGNISFVTEDGTLYKVHRSLLKRHYPEFACDHLSNSDDEGEPVRIYGVTSLDFDRFLSLIYPSYRGACGLSTVDEWTSALRLGTKWHMIGLRYQALRNIDVDSTPVDRITLAREFHLGNGWVVPSLVALCGAPEWIDDVEAARLGWRTVGEIRRIGKAARQAAAQGKPYVIDEAVLASEVFAIDPTATSDRYGGGKPIPLRNFPSVYEERTTQPTTPASNDDNAADDDNIHLMWTRPDLVEAF